MYNDFKLKLWHEEWWVMCIHSVNRHSFIHLFIAGWFACLFAKFLICLNKPAPLSQREHSTLFRKLFFPHWFCFGLFSLTYESYRHKHVKDWRWTVVKTSNPNVGQSDGVQAGS